MLRRPLEMASRDRRQRGPPFGRRDGPAVLVDPEGREDRGAGRCLLAALGPVRPESDGVVSVGPNGEVEQRLIDVHDVAVGTRPQDHLDIARQPDLGSEEPARLLDHARAPTRLTRRSMAAGRPASGARTSVSAIVDPGRAGSFGLDPYHTRSAGSAVRVHATAGGQRERQSGAPPRPGRGLVDADA